MSTDNPSTPTLTCKECAYENEPERVYCHNCGAKLDRSVLPKEEQIRRDDPERTRRRIMRMANPPSTIIRREVFALIKTLVCAAIAAGCIQAAQPPDRVPPARSSTLPRLLGGEVYELTQSASPRLDSFSEADVNAFIRTRTVNKGNVPGVEFKRIYVNLDPGIVRLVVEKSLWGYSFYIGTLERMEVKDGVLAMSNAGGNFGRLPVHPLIMGRAAPLLFGAVREAYQREWGLLQLMQSVVVGKERVDFVSRGRR